jgi:predicted metal-dependent peptidase
MVHGEQVFTENFENIATLLKPQGGGGTNVSSVSRYIVDKGYAPDCVVVFTDGYVETTIDWKVSSPTLWMVTMNHRRQFPGKVVTFNQ